MSPIFRVNFGKPLLAAVVLLLTACSEASAPSTQSEVAAEVAATTSAPAPQAASAPSPAARPTACELVSGNEMSEIFGQVLRTEAFEGSVDKTECIYKPADAVSPYIELTVEWGEGETAMRAAAAMASAEPGIADPYAGIGDQAVAVGTALMIRTGADLVTITFSGVDDAPGKARIIFGTLKPKL